MARSFSGTDLIDCGSAADVDNLAPGPMSGCGWLYLTTANTLARVFIKMNAAHTAGWSFTTHNNNNLMYVEARATTDRARITAANTLTVDTWTFVAFTGASSLVATDIHIYTASGTA